MKNARVVSVNKTETLISALAQHSRDLHLPENGKEALLSYILGGKIGILPPARVGASAGTGAHAVEIVRNHKRRIHKGTQIFFTERAPYVSRGGEKLEHALHEFKVTVENKIWLDIGASTGGFTDCLVQKKAKRVYAVDVGYNQLDYSLRMNPRVTVWERTNAMSLTKNSFPQQAPDAAVVDLSFRSLAGILKHVQALLADRYIVALCKPQFEWKAFGKHIDRHPGNFNGIVEKKYLAPLLNAVLLALYEEGIFVNRIIPSQIKGRKGNFEFFFEIKPDASIFQKIEAKQLYSSLCKKALSLM